MRKFFTLLFMLLVSQIILGYDLQVDGIKYNSEEVYSIVGNHTMRIYTQYGYVKVINFTILPKVSGVVDGETLIS